MEVKEPFSSSSPVPRRKLTRGVGSRHLINSPPVNLLAQVRNRPRTRFNETVRGSNGSSAILANNTRRFGDRRASFSQLAPYISKQYGPHGREGVNNSASNGLWTTSLNHTRAAQSVYNNVNNDFNTPPVKKTPTEKRAARQLALSKLGPNGLPPTAGGRSRRRTSRKSKKSRKTRRRY